MKYVLAVSILMSCMGGIVAQQITTVAVIDIEKVFAYFYRETAELRQIETKEQQYSTNLSNLRNRLGGLQRQRFEAQQQNNNALVGRLDAQIEDLSSYIQNLNTQYKNELAADRNKLLSDEFLRTLQETIRIVSEQNGYTLVLRKDTNGLQWWSSQIDISDLVVERLIEQSR